MVLNREFSLSDQVTAVFPKLRGFEALGVTGFFSKNAF